MNRLCPICKAPSAAGKIAPFCSERCRLIDLGHWLGESYRVPSAEPAPAAGVGLGGGDEDEGQ